MASTSYPGEVLQPAEAWVDELMRRLGWHDRQRAYSALLATLHALRDSLARDEAIHIGARLPVLLRGLYYEGWHPGSRRTSSRSAFLERISDGVHRDVAGDAGKVARATLAVLAAHMEAADLESAKAATPRALHNLWAS